MVCIWVIEEKKKMGDGNRGRTQRYLVIEVVAELKRYLVIEIWVFREMRIGFPAMLSMEIEFSSIFIDLNRIPIWEFDSHR